VSDTKNLIAMLKANRLFEDFNRRDLEMVIQGAKEVVHPQGREVIQEGRGGVGFHLILDGNAQVSSGGRKLRTLGPGDTFGDIAVIDNGPRSASVTAETPLRTLTIASWEFKPLLIEHPHMGFTLLLRLCTLLREAEKRPPV